MRRADNAITPVRNTCMQGSAPIMKNHLGMYSRWKLEEQAPAVESLCPRQAAAARAISNIATPGSRMRPCNIRSAIGCKVAVQACGHYYGTAHSGCQDINDAKECRMRT